MSIDNEVIRVDYNFRAKFLFKNTEIYKINELEFCIYVPVSKDRDETLNRMFEEVRPVGYPIRVVTTRPDHYECKLKSLADKDVVNDFKGFALPLHETVALINSLMGDVNLLTIKNDWENKKVILYFSDELKNKEKENAIQIAKGLGFIYEIEIVENYPVVKNVNLKNRDDPKKIHSYQEYNSIDAPYLRRDADLFFGNIAKVYSGKLDKEGLSCINDGKISCFVDSSIFKNINIRNYLMVYEKIYLLPPIGSIKPFLIDNEITKEELLYLAEKGRVIFVVLQPPTRIDFKFIYEAFERNEDSVLSSRFVDLVCAASFYELAHNFMFSSLIDEMDNDFILKMGKKEFCKDVTDFYNFMSWPQRSLKKSFYHLVGSGNFSLSSLGVNNLLGTMFERINSDKKFEFEFVVNSQITHVAHAFNSTLFPFITDIGYTNSSVVNLMSEILDMYSMNPFTSRDGKIDVLDLLKNRSEVLVKIFRLDNALSIQEFEDVIKGGEFTQTGQALFKEVFEAHDEDRMEILNKYNSQASELVKNREQISNFIDFSRSTLGFTSYIVSCINFLLDSCPKLRNEIEDYWYSKKVKGDGTESDKVNYLARISRVAKLKVCL